jgi:hypothetical protein
MDNLLNKIHFLLIFNEYFIIYKPFADREFEANLYCVASANMNCSLFTFLFSR